MTGDLGKRVLEGETRAVARLISLLENDDREAHAILARLAAGFGSSHIVGITGPPGSGKSTLTDKLIGEFRDRNLKVGILAVDPSSPFSGGAILGDRLRMQGHATDPGVFIRSLASRGRLGGLTAATAFSARVLEAAGFDIVVVETVGVGQSEIDIVKIADTVLLISVPGLGDEIQMIKAGIMEIGDIFVVNKADRGGADRVVREIRAMLETQAMLKRGRAAPGPDTLATHDLGSHNGLFLRGSPGSGGLEFAGAEELPPVLKTVAETGEGVAVLASAILDGFERSKADGSLAARRLEAIKQQLKDLVNARVMADFAAQGGDGALERLAKLVRAGEVDLYAASSELHDRLIRGETP
ncbi:MAG: methylmalonyl Co-A mutase-associated GTPase MeaB [Spirochaetes bacterium]|nr:methylmalonyl Co-A mutase-associated GTPase MeaB [Spirochaetota bacterium]